MELELYMLSFLRVFPVLVQPQTALLVAHNLLKNERGEKNQVFVVSIIWKEQAFDPLWCPAALNDSLPQCSTFCTQTQQNQAGTIICTHL